MESNMKRVLPAVVIVAACITVFVTSAVAQRAGQMSTIRYGTVVGKQNVDLNDGNAMKGALVGGAIGSAMSRKSSSSSKRRTSRAIGAVVGAGVAASKKKKGRRYSVRTNEGTVIQIATEQTEIQVDDCVIIEESGGRANIRRTALAACDPGSQSLMQGAEIQAELQEEAAECSAAKDGLVNAETDEQMELAVRKIQILCYN
jgi:outer membrane lipoprotein SlyB